VQQACAAAQPVPVAALLSLLVVLASLAVLASLGQVGGCAPQLLVTPHVAAVVRQAMQPVVMAA
jgi:hypothetical protein